MPVLDPPHDDELEQMVLSCVLVEPLSLLFEVVQKALKPSDFWSPIAQQVFLAMSRLRARSEDISCVALHKELQAARVEAAKADKYIRGLAELMPYGYDAGMWARKLREVGVRREIYYAGQRITKAAADPQVKLQTLVEGSHKIIPMLPSQAKLYACGNGPDAADALRERFEAEQRGELQTIPMPWRALSDQSNALRPGTVLIVAAPPGYGKTMFGAQLVSWLYDHRVSWAYLPLEGDRSDFMRRILAHRVGQWAILDDKQAGGDTRLKALIEKDDDIGSMGHYVMENPRLPARKPNGDMAVPDLPWPMVLRWLKESAEVCRVVVLDHLTQVDWGVGKDHVAQKKFMQQIPGIAKQYNATIVCMAHTIKKPGAQGKQLCMEDVQGAAEISRLSDCVILIDAHGEKTGEVINWVGLRETVTYDRTIIIDKARYGAGRGVRIACDFSQPALRELGVVAKKVMKSKAEPESDCPF